jgi:hypothetical protein
MKKLSFFFMVMLLIGSIGLLRAQNEVLHFFDDFNSEILTHWTTIDADGDGHCWHAGSDPDNGFYAYSSSYKRDASNYLVSPLLDGVTRITFDACASQGENMMGEGLSVYVSTTGNAVGDFLGNLFFHASITTSWTDIDVSLPEDTKYVAIYHGASYEDGLMVDNVKIWGIESNCIYSIYVDGFTEPNWGAHPDFDMTVSPDSHCSISDVVWYWESDSDAGEMSANSTFDNEDLSYYMGLYFTPQSGYHFSDYTRAYYNGNPDPFDVFYSSIVSGGEFRAWTINYYVDDHMGVEESTSERFPVWPNPTNDELYLEGMDGEMVNVYDNTGRLVLRERYDGHLDVSALAKGVYAITIADHTMKFVKK